MRLTDGQIETIRTVSKQIAGADAKIRLFGSRLNDELQGGDLDLMLEVSEPVENPALLSAQMAAKISRIMYGRKVDVILYAPNLMRLPIHDIALKEGVLL
ncbi:MAG: nucleotidyltransferase domain-containing protein [Methylococcales bacterium]|nr:nucleotidyltransferase domain-containing protein [Methylococcales bacterium]